jgi:hypothetical protein
VVVTDKRVHLRVVNVSPPDATERVMDDDPRVDAALVAAVLAGDRDAFGPLLLRWQPSVRRAVPAAGRCGPGG